MMARWSDGGVRPGAMPPGRAWVARRKPVTIPDGAPWIVTWREIGKLRVQFAASHQDAIKFAETLIGGDPA